MEGGLGGNTVPPNSFDKSKVLHVKPLRTLVPLFPDASEDGSPFVCMPPNGPFPSGFSPFFPFSGPQGSQSTPDLNQNNFNSTAVPIRSFRAEPPDSNGTHKHKSTGPSSVKKKVMRKKDAQLVITITSNFESEISSSDREDGNRELVLNVLLRFDALWKA